MLSGFTQVLCLILVLITFSCNSPNSPDQPLSGSATISYKMNAVGGLEKMAASQVISLNNLYITLSAPGESTILDTIPISGNSSQTITKTYSNLASATKSWTVSAVGKDINDSIIYSGTKSFVALPKNNVNVSLNLSPLFSMLKANFNPIRDSVTHCALFVDSIRVDSVSFAKQSMIGQSVQLEYDYLSATPAGTSHSVSLRVFGEMWGLDTLLYRKDTTIQVISGVNQIISLDLPWVGPDIPPPGQASINVTLGAAGTFTVNGHLVSAGSPSPFSGAWSRTELINDTSNVNFGKFALEAYVFLESPLQVNVIDAVCEDSVCVDTVLINDFETYDVTFGPLLQAAEGDTVTALDVTDANDGSTFYTIALIDSSSIPYSIAFGDPGNDPLAGTSDSNRVLSIGTNPEFFYLN